MGDLVNRGPDNLKTLRWFYEHRDNVTMVLGNHDLHLLAVSAGARNPSRKDNLDDILEAPDRETLIEWLHFRAAGPPRIWRDHVQESPLWSVEDTLQRAWGGGTALQGARCAEFLAAMYGNDPYVWDDQLSGGATKSDYQLPHPHAILHPQRQTRFGQPKAPSQFPMPCRAKKSRRGSATRTAHTRRENHFWSLGIAGRHHR